MGTNMRRSLTNKFWASRPRWVSFFLSFFLFLPTDQVGLRPGQEEPPRAGRKKERNLETHAKPDRKRLRPGLQGLAI